MPDSGHSPRDLDPGVRVMHSLLTCRIPLSAVTGYYRRNLLTPPVIPEAPGPSRPLDCSRDVRIAVRESPVDAWPSGHVGVTIAEFAAHVAYLEPVTGTGLLVAPRSGTDISLPDVWPEDVSWSKQCNEYGPTVGLSLQSADRAHALSQLARGGWTLLEDENGRVEKAGRTTDGRLAVCVYANRSTVNQLKLEDLQRALTALHSAADLRHT